MAENSKIEWTDHTFNPWSGCTKVSPACEHCYAEVNYSVKMRGVKWGKYGNRIIASDAMWKQPLKWDREAIGGRRQRVFCASLADVFEGPESMPADAWQAVSEARELLGRTIDRTPNLDWLLLTKRPENVLKYGPLAMRWTQEGMPSNVWIGTTVENQEWADKRIPELLRIPAAVRFLSIEPLLGPVKIFENGCPHPIQTPANETLPAGLLSWVIVGGESGSHARPMHPDWVRSLRDQCNAAGVPFFFKQWGNWHPSVVVDNPGMFGGRSYRSINGGTSSPAIRLPGRSGTFRNGVTRLMEPGEQTRGAYLWSNDLVSENVGKQIAGRILDGRTWDEMPEVKR